MAVSSLGKSMIEFFCLYNDCVLDVAGLYCDAHLAEGYVPRCPYSSGAEARSCSDFRPREDGQPTREEREFRWCIIILEEF